MSIGPIKDRGDPTGLIIHHGYIVAEWGDPLRVDMANSVTKSFLSSVVGIAVDRGYDHKYQRYRQGLHWAHTGLQSISRRQ